jgi:hypothetical protein
MLDNYVNKPLILAENEIQLDQYGLVQLVQVVTFQCQLFFNIKLQEILKSWKLSLAIDLTINRM